MASTQMLMGKRWLASATVIDGLLARTQMPEDNCLLESPLLLAGKRLLENTTVSVGNLYSACWSTSVLVGEHPIAHEQMLAVNHHGACWQAPKCLWACAFWRAPRCLLASA